MVSVDVQSLAWLAVVAILLAVPSEYLCHRRGWGVGARLLTWASGAAFVAALLILGPSAEEECTLLDAETCVALKQIEASLLPFVVGLSLALWSALFAMAVAVCRSIYRHALP
jgi:hypothetical protein